MPILVGLQFQERINFPFPYFIDLVLVVSMIWISWVEKIEFYIPHLILVNYTFY